MALFNRFRSEPSPADVIECRRCGTTLDSTATRCVECGSTEIARYEI